MKRPLIGLIGAGLLTTGILVATASDPGSPDSNGSMLFSKEKAALATQTLPEPVMSVANEANLTSATPLYGEYTAERTMYGYTNVYYLPGTVTITAGSGNNEINIRNLAGNDETVKATVNLSDNTVNIPGGSDFGTTPDGDVLKGYYVDYDVMKYDPSRPITGKILNNGVIQFQKGMMFLSVQGPNQGGQIMVTSEEISKLNATAVNTSLMFDNPEPQKIHVRRTSQGSIMIKNFYGIIGTSIKATLDSVGNVSLNTGSNVLKVGTTTYKNYAVKTLDETTPANCVMEGTSVKMKGKYEGNTITFGQWGLAAGTAKTAKKYDIITKTVITCEDAFTPYSAALTLQGEGTEASPYLISTPEDLQTLSRVTNYNANVVASRVALKGICFKQTANIDMSGIEAFEPISQQAAQAFGGIYDGGGFTIANLSVDESRKDANLAAALFGQLAEGGEIKNLTIKNALIKSVNKDVAAVAGYCKGKIYNVTVENANLLAPGSIYMGPLAGTLLEPGIVENCTASGTVKGNDMLGGAVGSSNGGHIVNVTSSVIPEPSMQASSTCKIGGICSNITRATGLIRNCLYQGTLSGKANEIIGGIAGYATACTLDNNMFAGIISHSPQKASSAKVGGIVADGNGVIITNCHSAGTIVAGQTPNIGGIAGQLDDKAQVNTSLSTASVVCGNAVRGNEITSTPADTTLYSVSNSYYDNQAAYNHGKGGLSTRALISGTLPEGFSADAWTAANGAYPVLKAFKDYSYIAVFSSPMVLADGENIKDVHSAFTLTTGPAVNWTFMNGSNLSDTGNGLKISGSNVSVTATAISTDVLAILSADNRIYKLFRVTTAPAMFEGAGTAEAPFLIKNKADLDKMFAAVDEEGYDFTGKNFRIVNDIDFTGMPATFRAYSKLGVDYAFNGTLDGDGHTFRNLVIGITADTKSNNFAGFMAYVGKDATVKNIVFDATCRFEGGSNVAPFILNGGKLENIVNHADVTAYYQSAAGITSIVSEGASVTGCYNDGAITSGDMYVGGIAAENNGIVDACQNSGKVSSKLLTNAVLTAPFNSDASRCCYAGGIVGDNNATVTNCLNQAVIAATSNIGGIIGRDWAGDDFVVKGNLNTGIVDDSEKALTHGAICGTSAAKNISDNIFDRQFGANAGVANTTPETCMGLTTAQLTAGTCPTQLKSDLWLCEAGKYPVLKAFAGQPASRFFAAGYVSFITEPRVESRFDNRSEALINLPEGAKASIATTDSYKIEGNKLLHDKTTAVQRGTLTITDGKYTIEASLFATPKLLANGSGLKNDPWIINNAADWNTLAIYSEENHAPFFGEYFALGADIDFADVGLVVWCGDDQTYFEGSLDGRKHTIKNASFQSTDNKAGSGKGLFGYVGANAEIFDFTVDKSCSIDGYQRVGMIAGISSGKIHDIVNYGNVTANSMTAVGGIVGYGEEGAQVYNCENHGAVTALKNNAAGGIIGNYEADRVLIHHNVNRGKVMAKGSCGGIIGSTKGNPGYDNVNYGEVESTTTNAGGIIGYLWTQKDECITVLNCKNYGDVKAATTSAGGIVAQLFRQQRVENCENHGNVTAGTNEAGGIVGTAADYAHELVNVTNYGAVKGAANVGGIIGNSKSTLKNPATLRGARNYGDVTGTKNDVGGIFGIMRGFTVEDSFNAGNVSGTYEVGGIAGYAYYDIGGNHIRRCFNVGAVSSTGTSATTAWKIGGIIGYGPAEITDCFNVGDISGYANVAGIVGLPYKGKSETELGTQVVNCYNVGRVECLDDTKANTCGQIHGDAATAVTLVKYSNCYYDLQMAGMGGAARADNADARGLKTSEMFTAALGEAFAAHDKGYPMLKGFENEPVAHLAAAAVVLADEDHADNVSHAFTVTMPGNVTWGGSVFTVDADGKTAWNNATPGNRHLLTATSGDFSRNVALNLAVASGIGVIDADNCTDDAEFFDINGLRVIKPSNGIFIMRKNGKSSKVYLK